MEIFIQAKFEDYNSGGASQKARELSHPLEEGTVMWVFETEDCTLNDVLLTVYRQSRCKWYCGPYKNQGRRTSLRSCLLILWKCCSFHWAGILLMWSLYYTNWNIMQWRERCLKYRENFSCLNFLFVLS